MDRDMFRHGHRHGHRYVLYKKMDIVTDIDLVHVAPDLFGHSPFRGYKIVCHNVDLLCIKRRRILCRIQKYKLSSVKIAPTKSEEQQKNYFSGLFVKKTLEKN
jgi:hypothetical protein